MPAPISNYRTNAFARSIFQHFTPATAYPTPPPPGISRSSSSLAHALGDPVSQQCRPAYGPEDSTVFFDEFLTQHSRDLIPAPVHPPPTPQRRSDPSTQESPDPLALLPSTPNAYTATTTPRKRKLVVEIESPYFKRVHSADATRASTIPPSHPPGSNTRKTLAYVEVPPLPMEWRTPPSKHKSRNYGGLWKPNHERAHDDLGGYGSEVDSSPSRVNVGGDARSSRRTGERDDRGLFITFSHHHMHSPAIQHRWKRLRPCSRTSSKPRMH
jgi:cohesin loading factor subunit SCC2